MSSAVGGGEGPHRNGCNLWLNHLRSVVSICRYTLAYVGGGFVIGTLLQVKQIVYVWLLVGNAIVILWALLLYALGKKSGTLFFRLIAFLQVLVLVEVAAGVTMMAAGLGTNLGHLLYAVLNAGLAVARLLAHGRLVRARQRGLLWQTFLALMAIALVARSSVTAYH